MRDNSQEVLVAAGVVIGKTSPEDDALVYVTLPAGWRKISTNFSSWQNLVDEKGRTRATIFYYSFLDAESQPQRQTVASLNVVTRFRIDHEETHDGTIRAIVQDSKKSVFVSEKPVADSTNINLFTAQSIAAMDEARNWLNQHYPEWQDPKKYWDD